MKCQQISCLKEPPGQPQPRYRVCAVTHPIWRRVLLKGLQTPGNYQSYNQQVYLKELFDLKHTIMQCDYETFEYLQHRL